MRVGSGLDTTGLTWLASDHLNSTSIMVNAATYEKTSELRYAPWGETRYTSGTPTTDRLYTGQREEAALGLYYYNARWYDPALSHFIMADTIIPGTENPLAWDRYAYTLNNPVNGIDPSGHFTVFLGAAIGAIAGVAIVAATHPNLEARDYLAAAVVGMTAGALIGTGVGLGAGTAIGATLVGAGAGAATSAAGYTVTAGDSYNSLEMAANAGIGVVTGAASALTGPAVVTANVAKGGAAILTRAAVNAAGTQASQIVHNEYFDEGIYPSGGELAGAAGLGAITSVGGDVADNAVSGAVTAISGNKVAGQVAGSLTYNLVKNFGSSYYVNQGLNWIDCVAEGGSCAN